LQPPLKQRAHNPNAALINEVRIEGLKPATSRASHNERCVILSILTVARFVDLD
jgi:hypothetical protein